MNSFISMLDALETNLRRAIVYSDIAKNFLFLTNLKATKLEIVRGIKLLEEAYREDVDPKLTNEFLHFLLYVRQTQGQGLIEEQSIFLSYGELYQIIRKKKIHTSFPDMEATLRLFLSSMVTNCSVERDLLKAQKALKIN